MGIFVGALLNNLPPLLFVLLMRDFNLSFEQVGRLVLINFTTQIVVILTSSRPVDRYGVRPFITAAHLFAFVGFLLFAFAPRLFPNHPYWALMIATFIFSIGGGLIEFLISAIVQAIPSDAKAAAMSLLHSFYAWGLIVVVLGTTLMLNIVKGLNWHYIVVAWAIVPLINFFNFMRVPLAPPIKEEERTPTKELLTSPFFLLVTLGIALGASSELAMSQWTSTFAESVLGLSKTTGDLLGLSVFAALMGVGRHLYGNYGKRVNILTVMFWGSAFAALCYLVASLSPIPILSLIACSLCGFGVSLLWPGSLSVAAERFPNAGSTVFALLAAGGAAGAALGPWLLGLIADNVPSSFPLSPLRVAMLVGTLFPISMMLTLAAIRRRQTLPKGQTSV